MKAAVIGAFVGAGLVAAAGAMPEKSQVFAQRPVSHESSASGDLVVLSTSAGENRQQYLVIDPQSRVMSVYHVDGASGEIALKCVRNIHWDLQMMEFNGTRPSPLEVRSLIEQP